MPNLAPKIPPKKLKDNWFQVCSNPEDPDDEGLCIQIIEGPFSHVVVKFKNFQTYKKLNDDGSLDCDYQYDIVHAPSTIGEENITDEQGVIYTGNPKILKNVCPGVFGEIKPVGYCMIGKR